MSGHNSTSLQGDNEKIVSYQKLRTFIGFIGLFLPIAVVLGSCIFGAGKNSWQHSISHYYYSKMHIVLICSLCVLGGFLITYKGRTLWESRLSNIAGYCAFGIAAFPTCFDGFQPPENGANQYIQLMPKVDSFRNGVHFAFAAALFICFIIFCLYFFQQPDEKYTGTDKIKFQRRKTIYTICGWGIIISIVMIAFFNFIIDPETGFFLYSTYIFETTSLWSFGIAWLVKGSEILKQVPVVKEFIKPIR